ncbi:hypothetical protein ANN_19428 [Periplaneta americana]|uniref:Uncharacterized protein n=1 Tax=Periplaneta americana TaxID=6978 RepID=A0ABQ8SAU8_PERAM|nr:hypothetical protein ANN_19428 [Periplaneta americana]
MAGLCEGGNEPAGSLRAIYFSKCKCSKDKKIPSDEREFIVDQRTMRKIVIGGTDLKMTRHNKKKEERKVNEQRKLKRLGRIKELR